MSARPRLPDGLHDTAVELWPEGAPRAVGDLDIDRPLLTIHLPEPDVVTGTGVIVNPGGNYRRLSSDKEGLQVARWLNRRGIAAFVLRYRVGERYHSDVSLLDGLRAVRLLRHRAADFGIAENRIGMLGFSAGGHLAVAVGTRWDVGNPEAEDPIERMCSRPDFLAPVYAITNGSLCGHNVDEYTPADVRVNESTPPTFLVHTHEDGIAPASQSTLFYDALLAAGVLAELHIYGFGEHGAGLGTGDLDFREWPVLLVNWLRRCGLLTGNSRQAVMGKATLDGEPMGWAWVSFLPIDNNAPPARARTSRGEEGRFRFRPRTGLFPVPIAWRYTTSVNSSHPPTRACTR